jgi:hypothetical protein
MWQQSCQKLTEFYITVHIIEAFKYDNRSFHSNLRRDWILALVRGGIEAKRLLVALAALAIALVGMAGAANYMYEEASVKGVGYKNVELIISTQSGFNGTKLVEKESGSGNVIADRTEVEAERQIGSRCGFKDLGPGINGSTNEKGYDVLSFDIGAGWSTGEPARDYINFTKDAEFEYMPVSYQTGTYDQKWVEKLCVQNYKIGAVLTEMYAHAESLQKTTVVRTLLYGNISESAKVALRRTGYAFPPSCCTGVLEAQLKSVVIGVAHIGWLSKDPLANKDLKGRHAEYGRSVEDLTGVFSIEKFIQLWGNSTCGQTSVDWLPCV